MFTLVFARDKTLFRPHSLKQDQPGMIMEITMSSSALEVQLFLCRSHDVDSHRVFVAGDDHVTQRVLPCPVLLDGIAPEG